MITTAGKYKAKISDYGVKEAKNGKPYVVVYFNIEGQGDVSWNGHLTEKTVEKTLKTLAHCGLKGSLEMLADGPTSGALDQTTEFDIDVEMKPGLKDPTKSYPNVKWVNVSRGAKFDAVVTASARTKLSQFSGNWAKVRTDMGVKKPEPSVGF